MAASMNPAGIFSATYSNVPVYEFSCEGCHVMRRRSDNWINATHILKVAQYDKPARTRILEREVQKTGVHEKVQGGYGKYQGTWIPLKDGRALAEKNGVLEKLRPIFDYSPGDTSPPPAPKHTTAASKARASKQQSSFTPKAQGKRRAAARLSKGKLMSPSMHLQAQTGQDEHFEYTNTQQTETAADASTVASRSSVDDDYYNSQQNNSHKRKHEDDLDYLSAQQIEFELYGDALLDFYMYRESESNCAPPKLPYAYDFTLKVDPQGRTTFHWAAAMADCHLIKKYLELRASPWVSDNDGRIPLVFATQFTNGYDKKIFVKMARLLQETIRYRDENNATIFHHISRSSSSRTRRRCAPYYAQVLIIKLLESMDTTQMATFLNTQDSNGDTALHIAVRNEAGDLVRLLQAHYAASDIHNKEGETADEMIRKWRANAMKQFPYPLSIQDSTTSFQEQTYKSEAAAKLSSEVLQFVLSNAENVATGYDAKLERKDEDLQESQVALTKMNDELLNVQKGYVELTNASGACNSVPQPRHFGALFQKNEIMFERVQATKLSDMVRTKIIKLDDDDQQDKNIKTQRSSSPSLTTPASSLSPSNTTATTTTTATVADATTATTKAPATSTNGISLNQILAPNPNKMANANSNSLPTPSSSASTATTTLFNSSVKLKAHIAANVTFDQLDRPRLVHETVLQESLSGNGRKISMYKDMVVAALGVEAGDPHSGILPDLVASVDDDLLEIATPVAVPVTGITTTNGILAAHTATVGAAVAPMRRFESLHHQS